MGITAVSTASLNSPGKGAGPQITADSTGADFAALLTQQLTGPQTLENPLQTLAGLDAGLGSKDTATELTEDDTSAGQDASAMLGLAGLLPAIMAATKPAQPAGDASLPKGTDREAGKDQIAGILGQLTNRSADDLKMESIGDAATNPAALATDLLPKDTANIAADSETGSGNGQNFAATLAAQSAQASRTQARNDNPTVATVSTPLHDSRWNQDFGDKVVWLAKNDQQVAQLNINPPQLGPMHISLSLNGDQASALFVSPHAEVRQAIQDAMPQLREMLAGAGINLGQANVGTQLPQQNNGTQPQFSEPSRSGDDRAILRAENGQGTSAPLTAVRAGRGMVDLFA